MTKDNSSRYYLHQKVKRLGAVVKSREKTVELENELFIYPSPILSVYLFKLSKFNYSIQSVIMSEEKKTTEIAKLITANDLAEKFKYVDSKAKIYDKSTLEVSVTTPEELTIAENNASDVHQLLKEAEKIRKAVKDPYAKAAKTIDEFAKIITDSLERSKTRLVSKITDYKVVQEAKAKADREAKLKELEDLEAEKREESARMLRIEQQIIARIFGGTYTIKDGSTKSSAGCIKSSECDELRKWIDVNRPGPELFKHFRTQYEDMLMNCQKRLAEHQKNLIDLENSAESPIAREGAMRRINENRTEAAQDHQENAVTTEKIIVKEIKSEVKAANNEVAQAGKNVRETLKWVVTDETLVTRDFLCVDELKLNAYMNANKEAIREALVRNEEVLPGIKFFVENKFIAR